jgi:hypothetical protein
MVVPLDVEGALIDWLVEMQWLEHREVFTRPQVADALRRTHADMVRGDRPEGR